MTSVLQANGNHFDNEHAPRDVFPDGLRTSGQHPPETDQLAPFSSFPKQIEGRTLWTTEYFTANRHEWTHDLSADEIAELGAAADAYISSGQPLEGLTKEAFSLPLLTPVMKRIRDDLLEGRGFTLMRGVPVNEWGVHKSAVAYMGLGTHIGNFVSQNGRGHILGHVKDLGDDATQTHKVRIYRTNARQFFHADPADVVGLLCLHKAIEGGESDVVSVHHVYNTLQKERPDVVETLTTPNWYFDRKGEVSKGQEEYIKTAVFYKEPRGQNRVFVKWDPYFVKSLSRFSDAGTIPALSQAQLDALKILEETCARLSLHMVLAPGDIQWVSDLHVLHARTAYKDSTDPNVRKRHLLRLWLATPESEGGWATPFKDTDEKKRGGIQVDNTAPRYVFDGE